MSVPAVHPLAMHPGHKPVFVRGVSAPLDQCPLILPTGQRLTRIAGWVWDAAVVGDRPGLGPRLVLVWQS